MLSKLKNLFSTKKEPNILDFQYIYSLFCPLLEETCEVIVKPPILGRLASITLYNFPDSFMEEPHFSRIKSAGFSHPLELFNAINRKSNVAEVSLTNENNYNFVMIEYQREVEDEKYLTKCCFFCIFLLGNENGDIDDYNLFYYESFETLFHEIFINLSWIPNPKNPTNEYKMAIKELEEIVFLGCKKAKIPIDAQLEEKFEHLMKIEQPSIELFREATALINWQNENNEEMDKIANEAFQEFVRLKGINNEDYEEFDYGFADFIIYEDNFWHSDWKFDPEEAALQLSSLIGEDFDFAYPPDTYSRNLFPYIQQALAEKGLKLMQMSSDGDYYRFIVVKLNHLDRLLLLNDILNLGIENVD